MGKVQKPSGWKDGQLRAVVRPTVLESKNEKINLMKQSAILGDVKRGKADVSQLPEGVIRSIETKAQIDAAIAIHSTDIQDIRQRLNITGKPLTIKTARANRDEINERFEKNRVKAASKGVNLSGLKKELSKKEQRDIDPQKIAKARAPISKNGAVAKKATTKTTAAKKPAAKTAKAK